MLEETEINSQAIERSPLSECVINLEKVTVKWPAAKETEDNTLTDVSFTVHPGQILAVVGQVGSGKVFCYLSRCNHRLRLERHSSFRVRFLMSFLGNLLFLKDPDRSRGKLLTPLKNHGSFPEPSGRTSSPAWSTTKKGTTA